MTQKKKERVTQLHYIKERDTPRQKKWEVYITTLQKAEDYTKSLMKGEGQVRVKN